MADQYTPQELKSLEKLIERWKDACSDELCEASWFSDRTRSDLTDKIDEAAALLLKTKKLRKDMELELDYDGKLLQDFVVVAFKPDPTAGRYSFHLKGATEPHAVNLAKKGFIAVTWPQITRDAASARFHKPEFQAWLELCYQPK